MRTTQPDPLVALVDQLNHDTLSAIETIARFIYTGQTGGDAYFLRQRRVLHTLSGAKLKHAIDKLRELCCPAAWGHGAYSERAFLVHEKVYRPLCYRHAWETTLATTSSWR